MLLDQFLDQLADSGALLDCPHLQFHVPSPFIYSSIDYLATNSSKLQNTVGSLVTEVNCSFILDSL
jgi:hypothetical protein